MIASASRIAAVLALFTACPAAAIVGPATEDSRLAPSVVMVLNRSGAAAGFCSGIVLAPTVVATAAHCVPQGADLRIHWPGDPAAPVLRPVTDVVRHPDYHADAIATRRRSIDLALLRLAEPLPLRFVPARIADRPAPAVGRRFAVVGYGVAREGDAASSGRLRATMLAARRPLSDVLLWAEGPEGAGACTGDSGGPVAAEGETTVTALTLWSAGPGNQHCGGLTQALWLAPHRDWIERIVLGWGTEVR